MSELIVNKISCQRGYNNLFSELSFSLTSGDILKISGANGSGKTSLLKILAGLSSAECGSVSYNQNKAGSSKYQQDSFYLGHLPALSPELRCQENLSFLSQLQGDDVTDKVKDALIDMGLKGYENEYAANLSAGQKRRVVLASLLINQAPIWLLDEPFTALDSDGVVILEEQINKHSNGGGLCVLTTHQECNLPNMQILSL
jgi:heme exporter protein A